MAGDAGRAASAAGSQTDVSLGGSRFLRFCLQGVVLGQYAVAKRKPSESTAVGYWGALNLLSTHIPSCQQQARFRVAGSWERRSPFLRQSPCSLRSCRVTASVCLSFPFFPCLLLLLWCGLAVSRQSLRSRFCFLASPQEAEFCCCAGGFRAPTSQEPTI